MNRSGGSSHGRLASRSGSVGAIARFWEKTYAPDYAGFALLLIAYLLFQFFVEPFHRMFYLSNLNISYPHASVERVSVGWMFVYAGGIPLLTLIVWLAVSRSNLHKFHVTVLGFFIASVLHVYLQERRANYLSLILSAFITDVIKNAVGRPRPDLLARCKAAPGTPSDILVTIDVCTETDHHILHDGWRSFPSGHSSFAFSGLGFLALFLCGQMHVFRPRADLGGALVALIPMLGAALIAISRCEDYRHDVYDVTCGSLLGFGVAYFSYHRYFSRLHSSRCHEPFPSRETSYNEGFGKVKDDEEAAQPAENGFELTDSDVEE